MNDNIVLPDGNPALIIHLLPHRRVVSNVRVRKEGNTINCEYAAWAAQRCHDIGPTHSDCDCGKSCFIIPVSIERGRSV